MVNFIRHLILHEKNRWLLVELIPARPGEANQKAMNGKDVYAALKQSILNNFGDTGWGAVAFSLTGRLSSFAYALDDSLTESFSVKYFSPTTNIGIIRVARDHHRTAWAALTLLSSIDEQKFIPNVVHVSGTFSLHLHYGSKMTN
jgi:ribonuclease P/MRP protein subunit POP5